MPLDSMDGKMATHLGRGTEELFNILASRYSRLRTLHTELGSEEDALDVISEDVRRTVEKLLKLEEDRILEEMGSVAKENENFEKAISRIKAVIGEGSLPITSPLRTVSNTKANSSPKKSSLRAVNARLSQQSEALMQLYHERLAKIQAVGQELSAYDPLAPLLHAEPSPDSANLKDVSENRLSALQKALTAAKAEHARRIEEARDLAAEIVSLWTGLEIMPTEAKDLVIVDISKLPIPSIENNDIFSKVKVSPTKVLDDKKASELIVTTSKMKEMQLLLENLHAKKTSNEHRIQELYDSILPLWERLLVPDSERDAFVSGWTGSSDTIVEAYEHELERVEKLKRDNMAIFFANTKRAIEDLCDLLFKSGPERASIQSRIAAAGEEMTDATLAKHEDIITELQVEYDRKRPVLELIGKYEALLAEFNDFIQQTQDTSRLTQRGARGDPGRLLREEKFRKRVDREKPRLEVEIHQRIMEWEAETEKEFLVRGERYVELLPVKEHRGIRPRNPNAMSNPSPAKPRSVTSSHSNPSIRPITPSLSKAAAPKTPGQSSVISIRSRAASVAPPTNPRAVSRVGRPNGMPTGIKTPADRKASHLPKPAVASDTPGLVRVRQATN